MVHKFRINTHYIVVEDPDNIEIVVENLRTYDPFHIKPGSLVAEAVIL